MRTQDLLLITLGLFFLTLPIFRFSTIPSSEAGERPVGVVAQDTLIHNKAFTEAANAYQEADFESAINGFSALASDTSQTRLVRRDALHYLGRAYLARQEVTQARDALTGMVGLEPPRIELDPDIEPPRLMRLYYDVRKECNDGDYSVESGIPMKTMAVLDFSNHSIDDHERLDPLEKGFTSLFINQLNGATDLKVIERERIQWLLDELDLQQNASRVDQQTAVHAGRLLGAQTVLMGSFIKHDKKLVMSARLVSVETSEILMSEQITGKADRFFDLADELSLKVAQRINVSLEETELGARRDTRSLDAMIAYSEGLDLLENERYRDAYEKFILALEFDPSYRRAQLKAKSIEPLLVMG